MFPLVHHLDYTLRQDGVAAFPWDKYGLVMDMLRGALPAPDEHEAPLMPRKWLEAVHDPAYVAQVLAADVPQDKARRIGFPVTGALCRRAQRTTGGTWEAARLALRYGYAANTAGGSHHALYDTGAGYCIFNDLAVAANRLIEEGDVRRILIVDLDVHQGDGTAALLAGRESVQTFSMHAERNFPARKAVSTLDIALPDGTEDEEYLEILDQHLPRMIDDGNPGLILYQAGVDPHRDDKLGRLSLSDEGLHIRDSLVASVARARGIPLASVLGGGYGADQAAVARRHADAIRIMAMSYYR
ncbi:histone deacetylase [Sphingobium phenoxybenzoativorans]|uniref:Histone deacetylase n=1 Tax=Sphingobium phenoxybenzoativorans TaxID=1592790 RepID=A0A975K9P9_9SPHN|nr:histone deacetylase [Sphingobium phenoxybenzoativorans]QUT07403.1 histone deacetylase [Sphingobium phenoxybenzoativorans]